MTEFILSMILSWFLLLLGVCLPIVIGLGCYIELGGTFSPMVMEYIRIGLGVLVALLGIASFFLSVFISNG